MPRRIQPAPELNPKRFRMVRENLGLTQAQFSGILGVSKGEIAHLEMNKRRVPAVLCERAYALQRARSFFDAELSRLERKRDWRSSKNFEQRPPFANRPEPGQACGCGHRKCVLEPVKDGDWPDAGHLWLFSGRICRKPVYVNEQGQKVSPPRRYSENKYPRETCSQCERNRHWSKKWSPRLGRLIYKQYCRRQEGDPPSLKHDPLSLYWERDGRIERIPAAVLETLHGRSRNSFPVPRCESQSCPRFGKTMERSAVLHLKLADGTRHDIATYKCRAPKPHAAYRVLPHGEVAQRLGFGRYRWTDGKGEVKETVPTKRSIRKGRIMPEATCREHSAKVKQVAGPWKREGKLRTWRGICTVGGEFLYVNSDATIRAVKDSQWKKKRRIANAVREKGRQQYKQSLPEVQNVREFLQSIERARIPTSEKLRLLDQHISVQSFKVLPNLLPDLKKQVDGDTILNPKAWTAQAIVDVLAPRFGVTGPTFTRKFLYHP